MAKQDEYARYTIRVPADLYDLVVSAAADSGRSINAEIIARLEVTLRGLGDLNLIGVDALVKRLEASAQISEELMFKLLYEVRSSGGAYGGSDLEVSQAVERYAEDTGQNKAHAAYLILRDWLQSHGFLPSPDQPQPASSPPGQDAHLAPTPGPLSNPPRKLDL